MTEFPDGTLHMSSSPFLIQGQEVIWSREPLVSVLILSSVVIFLILVKDFIAVFPYCLDGLTRTKANFTISDSLRMIRCRRMACLSLLLPLGLVFARFFPNSLTIGIAAVSYVSYLLAAGLLPVHAKVDSAHWRASSGCILTYFVPFACTVILTAALSTIPGFPTGMLRLVFQIETALFYLLYIIRKWQILADTCRFLPSFLYLCALDFIPMGLIIALV